MTKLPIQTRAPKLRHTVSRILQWADDFHETHGRWPKSDDGRIAGTADENWNAVDHALSIGLRGLAGGTTLAKLLFRHRGRPHWHLPPDLSIPKILAWADAFHRRTGDWPKYLDGAIPRTRDTWSSVHTALVRGTRSLPGGSSLAGILEKHREVRNHLSAPPLTEAIILEWADHHYRSTGQYPKHNDGAILAAKGETWSGVENALRVGNRDLPGGDSLAKFLTRHRGVRNKSALPPLTLPQIREWAHAMKERTGRWPTHLSGPIQEAPGETWAAVHGALSSGLRGLPGGDSLAQFLEHEFGRRNSRAVPPLTLKMIRGWILQHYATTGQWPHALAGPINGVPNESWGAVANAMQRGSRGLSKSMTLAGLVRSCGKKQVRR